MLLSAGIEDHGQAYSSAQDVLDSYPDNAEARTIIKELADKFHEKKIFDQAALRAIARWRYNPKIEDGVAVERVGVRTRLTFQLEK